MIEASEYFQESLFYGRRDRWNDAYEVLEEGRVRFPNDLHLLTRLGVCYRNAGKLAASKRNLLDALRLCEKNFPGREERLILTELGITSRHMCPFNEAFPYFERSLAIESDHPITCSELGILYASIGEFEKATQAVRQTELGVLSRWALGVINWHSNDLEKSKDIFHGMRRNDRSNYEARVGLALTYMMDYRKSDAEFHIEPMRRLRPNAPLTKKVMSAYNLYRTQSTAVPFMARQIALTL